MAKIIECVPNFSEGRDKAKIKQIVAVIQSVPDILLLDVESDVNHNRSVVSFVGPPQAVLEAAFIACQRAMQLIDLNKHRGEHPRMGATDVIPFIPIENVSLTECVVLSHQLGQRIGSELKIPVYFYEASALRPDRENLAAIRVGEFEGLKKEIGSNPTKTPDAGPMQIHKTAGATAVGARMPLIAYNINLDTTDLSLAKDIAKAVRFSSGGFRYVKALGFALSDRKLVQVSMNMTNYQKTPLYRVFETVKTEAQRRGTAVAESEIVGLVPLKAITDSASYYLQLNTFRENQLLEKAIKAKKNEKEKTLAAFLEELSAKTTTPAGGSIAALEGALAAGLLLMVLRFSLKKNLVRKKREQLLDGCHQLGRLRQALYQAMSEDAEAYEQLAALKRQIKHGGSNNRPVIASQYADAVHQACQVPMQVLSLVEELIQLADKTRSMINPNLRSDLLVALSSMEASLKSAYTNVVVNLPEIANKKQATKIKQKATKIINQNLRQLEAIEATIKL